MKAASAAAAEKQAAESVVSSAAATDSVAAAPMDLQIEREMREPVSEEMKEETSKTKASVGL